ncbi:MAG: tetratricopeptide repeat protein, partial [Gemmatimonadetes bacterium]|nr:tetratricopeptide repeat protein [Gemmatimonadota bacterium]
MKLSWVVLLLFLIAWGCARDDPLLVEGQQHFYNREYQVAIEVLQRAVQAPSPSPAAYRYLGRCYLQVGQYEQAREAAHAGLARDANDPELYDLLGAIEMTRAFAEARYSDTDVALNAFQRAIELDPQRATTHYNLGLVYSYRDSAHRAECAYLAALQVDSTLAPAHKKLGLYYRRQGTLDQALSHLQRAVQYAPEDAEAHFHRGLLLRAQGHYDQAVEALERAAELNPYSPQVHFNLSQLYLRTGQREQGEKALARSEILRQHHRGIGSDQSLPEVSAVAIGSATARYNLALNLALQGQYDQAILEYQNTLAINPELK